MPRKGNVMFVPDNAPDTIPLEQIPQEVIDEVEEIYALTQSGTKGRFRAEFDTKEEARQYAAQVSSYCAQRPGGPIRYRKSPTRGLPETMVDFRITDLTENEPTPAPTPANARPVKATKK